MIIGRTSSKLGVIRIQIRIGDPYPGIQINVSHRILMKFGELPIFWIVTQSLIYITSYFHRNTEFKVWRDLPNKGFRGICALRVPFVALFSL